MSREAVSRSTWGNGTPPNKDLFPAHIYKNTAAVLGWSWQAGGGVEAFGGSNAYRVAYRWLSGRTRTATNKFSLALPSAEAIA
jgi:hypothetical protein